MPVTSSTKGQSSLGVYRQLAGKPGLGPINRDEGRAVTEIASPMGVVFALGPVTNPVSTFIYKALICVKSRNAMIYSPNRRAQGVATRVGDIIQEVLCEHGAPQDLVQCVRSRTSRKQTAEFMSHAGVSFILAPGGPSMVQAAYSSGTPAIGVGPGNAPVLIAGDADIPSVVEGLLLSKTFDNGPPCAAEHNLVVVSSVRQALIEECERQGAAVLSPEEAERFTRHVTRPGANRFKGTIVGQPAEALAGAAGISREYPIRLLIVPSEGVQPDNPYTREKMAPMLSLFTVRDEEEGLKACYDLLMIDGTGHTACIHSQDEALIQRFAEMMPASRILANSPLVHGILGITSGLNIAFTLGCGTFGRTSTTDNVSHANLRNVKRLAAFLPEAAESWEPLMRATSSEP
jgi:acetaldehyde dehydrogenase/alcohol dehydrogenase